MKDVERTLPESCLGDASDELDGVLAPPCSAETGTLETQRYSPLRGDQEIVLKIHSSPVRLAGQAVGSFRLQNAILLVRTRRTRNGSQEWGDGDFRETVVSR